MQGGHQLPKSDQKRLDEVRRIREAMARGGPILADSDRDEDARVLGKGGEQLSSNYLLAFKYRLYISGTPVGTGSSRGLYREGNHIPPAGYGSLGIRMLANYVKHRYYHPK
jgi:hypothetical protein